MHVPMTNASRLDVGALCLQHLLHHGVSVAHARAQVRGAAVLRTQNKHLQVAPKPAFIVDQTFFQRG